MSGFFKQTKQGASTGSTLTPNVGQYGWTLYESQSVSQIIGFVNEAKGYAVDAASSATSARESSELTLVYVNEAKEWAGRAEVSYGNSKDEADRSERYANQSVDIYNAFLNVAANQRIVETFDLTADQTVVNFTKIFADAAYISVNGQRVDSSNLVKDLDYTVTNVSQITLKRRYPVGTKLSAVQDIKKDDSIPGVSESSSIWNRQFINALVGVNFGTYVTDGRTLTPRLVFEGSQYVPEYDATESVTLTDIPVKQNNGDLIVGTSKGDRRFSRTRAEAVARKDIDWLPISITSSEFGGDPTSANNDSAIALAIAKARATKSSVYWDSVYEVQGNIDNFHSVQHTGPGGVKRGTDIFYVSKDDVVCKLYSSTTSPEINDGITEAFPRTLDHNMLTAQAMLEGNASVRLWIYLANGSYNPLAHESRLTVGGMKWFVKVIGKSVSDCIIDAKGASANLAVVRGAGAKLWIENVHLKNTRGSSLLVAEGAIGQLVDCNQTDCYYGLSGQSHSEIYMSGGTHHFTSGFGGYSQVRSMFLTKHTIGYKYDEDLGYGVADVAGKCPKFTTASAQGRGFFAQEGSTGHVRCDLISGYSNGVELVASSRAHLENTLSIERCARGAELENGCNIYDAGINWNQRGAAKNGQTIRYLGGVITNKTQGSIRQRMGFKDITGATVATSTATPLNLGFQTDGISNAPGSTYTVTLTGNIDGKGGKKDFALTYSGGYVARIIFPASASGAFRLEIGFVKTTGDFVLPIGQAVAGGFSGDAGVAECVTSSAPFGRIIDNGPGTLDVQAFVENTSDKITFNLATLHFEG